MIFIKGGKIMPQKQWVKFTAVERFRRKAHVIALILLIVAATLWLLEIDSIKILITVAYGFIGGIMGIYVTSLFIVPQAICPCGNVVNLDKESNCEKCGEKIPVEMYG